MVRRPSGCLGDCALKAQRRKIERVDESLDQLGVTAEYLETGSDMREDELRESDVWEAPMSARTLNAIPFKRTRYESGEEACSSRRC
jgi:hypothetical protein